MRALFLDRDGVINVDHGYVSKINDFKFIDGIFEFCQKAIDKGYLIIVVTNQTGIALNNYTLEDFLQVNNYMLDSFRKENITISDVFFCPHHPKGNCLCHKPKPKMILDARDKYNIDLKNSIMIGDKTTDALCGYNANVGNIYLYNNNEKLDFDVKYITDFKEVIL